MAKKIEVGVKSVVKINADDDTPLSNMMAALACITSTDKADVEDVEVIDHECIDSR